MSALTGPEIVLYIRARIEDVQEFSDWTDDLHSILDDAAVRAEWDGKQADLAIAGEWFESETAPEGPWLA